MMGLTSRRPDRIKNRQMKTRVKLLRAAYHLMSKNGVDATTIQEITDSADVGFGTFYNYFLSKDDLATQVLDCVINNLGRRNDLVTKSANLTDPVLIVSTSVRQVAREMMTNPMWRWWVQRPDLLVERMRAGFHPFGIRDMQTASKAGRYNIVGNDVETAWSFLIWLLAGGIKDMVDGYRPAEIEGFIAESVMRVMGVSREEAAAVSKVPLPAYPRLDIDFAFVLKERPAAA